MTAEQGFEAGADRRARSHRREAPTSDPNRGDALAPVIPFTGRIGPEETAAWIAALQDALPQARIAPLDSLDEADRAAAQVAMVANPDPAALARLPQLVWVQSLWAGVERLLAEMRDDRIAIVRLEDPELARTMAEAVLAWTLYLHRDMPRYAAQQRARVWKQHPVRRPGEVAVALLGLGALGRAAAAPLVQHGFRVIGWSRTAKAVDGVETRSGAEGLHATLAKADIAVVLLPLTPDTRGLLDGRALDAMKPGAGLVNFARGPIVETQALLERLTSGRLGHAVLDVFATEPLPADDPCWIHPAVTVLPHISAPTTKASAARIAAANVATFLKTGAIPPAVDRARGY